MKVYKSGLDWVAVCDECLTDVYCPDWELAYETAVGHVVVHHGILPGQTVIPLEDLLDMTRIISRFEAFEALR